jgi:hypothetical protein
MTPSLFMLLFIISALPGVVIACLALFRKKVAQTELTESRESK